MCTEPFKFTGHEITGYDTLSLAVYDNQVKHFVTRITGYRSGCDLAVEGCISSEKKLLAGLSPGIEGSADLYTSERTVGKVSAVFTGERNTLGNTLVDDSGAHFCQTIDIGLTTAIVSSLDGIIEKTVNSVVVILVILGSIYTSLSCNRVCPSR